MPLLRLVGTTSWNVGAAPDSAEGAINRSKFRREPDPGLSFWRVQSESEIATALAGFTIDRVRRVAWQRRIKPVEVLQIPDAEVLARGAITATPGECPLATANALHVELQWPQDAIDALIDHVAGVLRIELTRFNKQSIVTALRAVDPAALDSDDARAWLAWASTQQTHEP